MPMMKSGLFQPRRLVGLRRIGHAFAGIRRSSPDELAAGELAVGAMVRLADLAASPEIAQAAPVIARTLRTHSNVRVRNVATIGGNLAHGDPHMDLPPVLIALGALVVATGPEGVRRIAVEDLVCGYYETVLAGNELITEIVLPAAPGRSTAYAKCTTRAADDWPALGIAVSLSAEEGVVRAPRLVVSAATERAMRLARTEALLEGRAGDAALVREAASCAAEEAPVVADSRGSAAYKRVLVRVHAERVLREVLGLAGAGEAA
jgi:carbon-monoxide dehydrogenase medium subunit